MITFDQVAETLGWRRGKAEDWDAHGIPLDHAPLWVRIDGQGDGWIVMPDFDRCDFARTLSRGNEVLSGRPSNPPNPPDPQPDLDIRG